MWFLELGYESLLQCEKYLTRNDDADDTEIIWEMFIGDTVTGIRRPTMANHTLQADYVAEENKRICWKNRSAHALGQKPSNWIIIADAADAAAAPPRPT